MKVSRFPLSFSLIFFLFTLSFVDNFRRSSEAKLNAFVALKNSKLPIVVVTTDAKKPIKSREKYRRADVYFFNSFSDALAQEENPSENPAVSLRCRIRGRGNSTWRTFDTNKRSYLLKLDDETELFGMKSARKWILQANVTDKTSLRNAYAYHLGAEIFDKAGWTPKTQFVNLVVNGKSLGLYGLMEKAEIAPNRLDLPTEPGDESFLAEVNSRLNRAWNFRTDKGVAFSIREKEGASQEYYRAAEKRLKDFEKLLFSEDFSDPIRGYRACIDFDSFVDWYLVNEFTKNHDARFQDSCFLTYDSRDGLLHMGPIWDFDISCGNNQGECANPEGLFIQSRGWFARLWEDSYFRTKVADRWRECRAKIEESLSWIYETADFLEDDAYLDNEVWQRFGYRQWPNAPGCKERKTYRAEVDYMMEWLRKRILWFDKEFAEKS